jgi:hypothetical protein
VFGRALPSTPSADAAPARPTLHLSGPRLRQALETLVQGSEKDGGVERYVEALGLKARMFRDTLADGRVLTLDKNAFKALCAFIAPVRRRIGIKLDADGFLAIRAALGDLLDGAHDTATADARIQAFQRRFPNDREHRWVRDLAAEALHYTDPERYPLMARWVWDAKANTGVLREIWHGENVDHMVIDVADDYGTFLVLREELSQFLTDNGVFRDVLFYVDLVCAQVYADYIGAQGGSYLRTDFAQPMDPMQYVRRMLGLDGVDAKSARTRLRDIDGEAYVLEDDLKTLDWAQGRDDADS